jgi:hypothetical protein
MRILVLPVCFYYQLNPVVRNVLNEKAHASRISNRVVRKFWFLNSFRLKTRLPGYYRLGPAWLGFLCGFSAAAPPGVCKRRRFLKRRLCGMCQKGPRIDTDFHGF